MTDEQYVSQAGVTVAGRPRRGMVTSQAGATIIGRLPRGVRVSQVGITVIVQPKPVKKWRVWLPVILRAFRRVYGR